MFEIKPWTSRIALCVALLAPACADDADTDGAANPALPDGGLSAWDAGFSADASVGPLTPGQPFDASTPGFDAAPPAAAGGRDSGNANLNDSAAAQRDASGAGDADATSDTGAIDPGTCAVAPLPDAVRSSYRMGAIYKRYADANGVPVIASEKPSDEAIRRACLLVLDYSSVRTDVREALLNRKVRFIMMAKSEKTVNFPEYAALGDLDARARGLGGVTDAICAEESVLCDRATDRWRGESICVHEYAHTMHSGAWSVAIPDFNTRLDAAFRAALAAGKYANTYAGSKLSEYLAEGVQDWYNTNLESATPNGIHNHINTRTELEAYDPTLYALLKEVLPDRPTFRDCYYYE
jgi:hypothetical protein